MSLGFSLTERRVPSDGENILIEIFERERVWRCKLETRQVTFYVTAFQLTCL